ncbi:hypothetical protein HDU97_004178 [Phlyctochytrium planicorne]|nr:hypothetical protein HDU97_004178 [Phlyctochytrium planicorne]
MTDHSPSTSALLDALPFDVLDPILCFLLRRDLARLAQTCKRASNDSRFMGRLYRDLRNKLTMPPAASLKRHGRFVEGLKIDLGNPSVLEALSDLDGARALTNLQKLVVKLPEFKKAEGTGQLLSTFLKNLPNPSRVFSVSLEGPKKLHWYQGSGGFQMFSGCFDVLTDIQQLSVLYAISLNLFLASSNTVRKLRLYASFVNGCSIEDDEDELKNLLENTQALKQLENLECLQLDCLTYMYPFSFMFERFPSTVKEIGVGYMYDADGDEPFDEEEVDNAVGDLREFLPEGMKLEFKKEESPRSLWDLERIDDSDMP